MRHYFTFGTKVLYGRERTKMCDASSKYNAEIIATTLNACVIDNLLIEIQKVLSFFRREWLEMLYLADTYVIGENTFNYLDLHLTKKTLELRFNGSFTIIFRDDSSFKIVQSTLSTGRHNITCVN